MEAEAAAAAWPAGRAAVGAVAAAAEGAVAARNAGLAGRDAAVAPGRPLHTLHDNPQQCNNNVSLCLPSLCVNQWLCFHLGLVRWVHAQMQPSWDKSGGSGGAQTTLSHLGCVLLERVQGAGAGVAQADVHVAAVGVRLVPQRCIRRPVFPRRTSCRCVPRKDQHAMQLMVPQMLL